MFYMKYSYIRLRQIYLALAVKNIQASLIFLARFFVYSHEICRCCLLVRFLLYVRQWWSDVPSVCAMRNLKLKV